MNEASWTLYLLRNERGALYTGITTDLQRRIREHRGKTSSAARYTRACKELEVVYTCMIGPRSLALKAESRVKKLTKSAKEELVNMRPGHDELLTLLKLAD